jgi:hypothetical protein
VSFPNNINIPFNADVFLNGLYEIGVPSTKDLACRFNSFLAHHWKERKN